MGRLIWMRVFDVFAAAVAASLSAGCGVQAGAGATGSQSGITGRIQLGPQCPIETEDHPCPDKPATGASVIVSKPATGNSHGGGNVVARTLTDRRGIYHVILAPGTYVVTADVGISCELMATRVTTGDYATVDIPCDTGIR